MLRRALEGGVRAVAVAMFVAVFAVFLLKVALRYLFNDPVAWADEVSAILFVWIIFWANALLLGEREQIRFDLVLRLLPPRGRRVAAILRNGVILLLVAAGMPAALSYLWFLRGQTTPVLQWPMGAVFACFGLFLGAVCVRSGLAMWRACRSG